MNNKQKLHQLHLNEWAARFTDQKSSGLTVRQWCEQNNYTIHTYNYWKHRLKDELANQILPKIVPLSIPPASATTGNHSSYYLNSTTQHESSELRDSHVSLYCYSLRKLKGKNKILKQTLSIHYIMLFLFPSRYFRNIYYFFICKQLTIL